MKYIKTFERYHNFPEYKVGDIVVIIDEYDIMESDMRNGDKCIITSLDCLDDENNEYIKVEDLRNGEKSDYHKRRIIPEEQYYAKKFNI